MTFDLFISSGEEVSEFTFHSPQPDHLNIFYLSMSPSTLSDSSQEQNKKTYKSWDSLVVTRLTTYWPASGSRAAEKTEIAAFHTLRSYVFIKFEEQYATGRLWTRRIPLTTKLL